MDYNINKGVDKSVDLLGLKNQYILLAGGGTFVIFVITIILLVSRVFSLYILCFIVIAGGILVLGSIWLSKNMGAHGITKIMVKKQTPQFLTNRVLCKRFLINKKQNNND